jgi:hypothetical protein
LYQDENKPKQRSGGRIALMVGGSFLGILVFAVLVNQLNALFQIPYAELIVFFAVVAVCIVLLNALMTKYVYFLSDEHLYFVRSVGGSQRLLRKVSLDTISFFGKPEEVLADKLPREKFTLDKPEKAMGLVFEADGKQWLAFFSPGEELQRRLSHNLQEQSWKNPRKADEEIWGKDEEQAEEG